MNIPDFERLLQQSKLDMLMEVLKDEIMADPDIIEARFQLAKVHIKKNDYANAVNLFIEILKIDPSNEEALVQKESATSILSMGQLDIYACPNTHLDPWQ